MKRIPALYAVADAAFGDPVDISERLFRSGVRFLQVRNKRAKSGELLQQTVRILKAAPKGAGVMVNDRADIALISGAAGVHLGQADLPPSAGRSMLGPARIVGVSTHDAIQASAAAGEPVDYIAVGPVFETATKKDHAPVLGLDGLAEICRQVVLPVVAIGGIRLENLDEVFAAGACSVAVISDLIGSERIEARAEEFLNRLAGISGTETEFRA